LKTPTHLTQRGERERIDAKKGTMKPHSSEPEKKRERPRLKKNCWKSRLGGPWAIKTKKGKGAASKKGGSA